MKINKLAVEKVDIFLLRSCLKIDKSRTFATEGVFTSIDHAKRYAVGNCVDFAIDQYDTVAPCISRRVWNSWNDYKE